MTVNGADKLVDVDFPSKLKLQSDLAVAEDGYVLLSVGAIDTGTTIKRNDGKTDVDITDTTTITDTDQIPDPYTHAYLMRPGSKGLAAGTSETITYCTLSCDDTNFYYTPEFAKTAVNNSSEKPDAKNLENLSVRTARQLTCIGTGVKGKWEINGFTFKQERDIDFKTYANKDVLKFVPIGYPYLHSNGGGDQKNVGFLGTYDGGEKIITGLDITNSKENRVAHEIGKGNGKKDKQEDFVGLFGAIAAGSTVKNVTFVSDMDKVDEQFTDSRNVAGGDYVGALAGRNRGTIENCVVAGFDVKGGQYVGGLVGYNAENGTIRNCSADNGHFAVKTRGTGGNYSFSDNAAVGGSVSGTSNVGGFVGANIGEITNAYAVVRLPGVTSATETTGGFVGTNSGTIEKAYCAAVGEKDEVDQYGAVTRDYIAFSPSNGGTQNDCYSLNDSNPRGTALSYAELTTKFKGESGWNKMEKKEDGLTRHYSTSHDAAHAFYPFCTVVIRTGRPAHYGNWPLKEMNNVSLGYYEIYPATPTGFTTLEDYSGDYLMGIYCEELGMNTLKNDAPILQDGYTLLFRVDDPNVEETQYKSGNILLNKMSEDATITWQNHSGGYSYSQKRLRSVNRMVLNAPAVDYNGSSKPDQAREIRYNGGSKPLLGYANDQGDPYHYYTKWRAINVGEKGYYIPMVLEFDVTTSDSYIPTGTLTKENYYQSLTVTDSNSVTRTFRYNPHFARSAVGLAADEVPALPSEVNIRTERQFCLLTKAGLIADNSYCGGQEGQLPIRQTRDLIFGNSQHYTNEYYQKYDVGNQTEQTFLWNPASEKSVFNGVYDGQNHTIDLAGTTTDAGGHVIMDINGNNRGKDGGVFGTVTGGSISNLKVKNLKVSSGVSAYVGGLANKVLGGTIQKCMVENVFISLPSTDAERMGGLAGQLGSWDEKKGLDIKIEDCSVTNVVIDCKIDHSRHLGGLVGRMEYGTIKDCSVSVNDIKGTRYVGGAVGRVTNGTVSGLTVQKFEGAGGTIYGHQGVVGGAIGQADIEKTDGQKIDLSGLTVENLAVSSKTKFDDAQKGTGGVIGNILNKNKPNSTIQVGGTNVARSVTVSAEQDYAGGFVGSVTTSGTGKFTLRNASVETSAVTGMYAGGFVGSMTSGSVTDCYVSDSIVTGSADAGAAGSRHAVGGFAGQLSGTAFSCGVRSSSVTGTKNTDVVDVAADGRPFVGGFAGITAKGTKVDQCYSAASVENGYAVGGFVGITTGGTFRDCYASGQVRNTNGTEASSTGGFVGQSVKAPEASGKSEISTFVNCFASGDVDTAKLPRGNDGAEEKFDGVGGFIGSSQAGNFQECYSVGKVTVNQQSVAYDGSTDHSHVGGFVGYGTPQEGANDVLRQLMLFIDIMENTYVVNRVSAPGSKGTLNEAGKQKLENGQPLYNLTDADFENLDECWKFTDYIADSRNNTKTVDSGALLNGSGTVGDWDHNTGEYCLTGSDGKLTDGSLAWNVVRTMQDRYDTSGGEMQVVYGKIQNALWRVTSQDGNAQIFWAMEGDNAELLDHDYQAGTDDWREYLYRKYREGIVNRELIGYYYETKNPGYVYKCKLKLGVGTFGSEYVTIAIKGDDIETIVLSPTKILPSFYLYVESQETNCFSGYNYDDTGVNKAYYPYSDQHRFIWLERWSSDDFDSRGASSFPEMKVIAGSDYPYPVPKAFAEYVPGTTFSSSATTRRKKYNVLGA